jgi:hypothetical protein
MGKTLGINFYPLVFIAGNGLILLGLGGMQLHSKSDFIAISTAMGFLIGKAGQFGAKCLFYRGAIPTECAS